MQYDRPAALCKIIFYYDTNPSITLQKISFPFYLNNSTNMYTEKSEKKCGLKFDTMRNVEYTLCLKKRPNFETV